MIYDDDISTFTARQEVLDRLAQATVPTGVNPGLGPELQPDRRILREFGEEKARRNAPFGGRFVRYAAAASGCMCPSCVRSVY